MGNQHDKHDRSVLIAIITLIGTLFVAYFGYKATISTVLIPINATQTAEARLIISPTEMIVTNTPQNPEIIPSFTPTHLPIAGPDFGSYIIVTKIGFDDYQSAWSYLKRFEHLGFSMLVISRKSDISATIADFSSEAEVNNALSRVQFIEPSSYIVQFQEWCPVFSVAYNYLDCP